MKKGVVIGIIVAVVVLCGVCGIVSLLMSKGSTNTTQTNSDTNSTTSVSEVNVEEPKIEIIDVDMNNFVNEFDTNQIAAEKKYENKAIKTNGYVTNISEDFLGNIYFSVKPVNDEYYFGTTVQCFPKNEDIVLNIVNGQQINYSGNVKEQSIGIIVLDNCEIL